MCLKCFNGGCADAHSIEHASSHVHPLAVNIRTVKRVSGDPSKITKVAIGVSGGSGLEEWETIATPKCLLCEVTLPATPSLTSLIDSILVSNSAMFQASVESWENQLFECEHTLTLKQTKKIVAQKSLASCGLCDLKNNLWLCMTCGQLGCGRKNYDGTGGNGHGLEHYSTSKHPLVCKMGTITPEGTAAIHCYICDDGVLDSNLASHLLNFGIVIAEQVKTEKTTTELELEANLNLTLSLAVEEGRILTPRYGSGYTGLANLGNSCYMSSILQTLFSIPEWMNRFNDPNLLSSKDPANSFYTQMAKLAIAISTGKYSIQKWTVPVETEPGKFTEPQEYQDGIKPSMLKSIVGKGHPEFSSPKQQDAFEYFQHLMTVTERQEKANGTSHLSPTSVFEFQLTTKILCTRCNKSRLSDHKQNSISTSIPIDPSLDSPDLVVPWDKLLENFAAPENIEFNCPQCRTSTPGLKSYSFKTFPSVLVLVVNRFVCPDWVPKKLKCGIQVPLAEFSLLHLYRQETGEILPEEASEPSVRQDLFYQLLDMGMTDVQATNGLLKTGNTSVEAAATWIFENFDNPELNQAPSSNSADVEFLVSMGFTAGQAKNALKKCDGDPERAVEYLFSHQDDMQVEEIKHEVPASANYQFFSVVTHLGASVHSGHYVAHIFKNSECVLFNDNKVAATSDPPLGKGYIYFFRKVI